MKKYLHVPFVPIGYKSERVGTAKGSAQSSLRPCLYYRRGGVVPEASYAAEVVRRDFVQRLRPPLSDYYAATSAEGGFNPRRRLPRRYFFRRVTILLCAKAGKETARHGGLFFRARGRQTIDYKGRALRRSIFVQRRDYGAGRELRGFCRKIQAEKDH